MTSYPRRSALALFGTAFLAGCLSDPDDFPGGDNSSPDAGMPGSDDPSENEVPTTDNSLPLPAEPDTLHDAMTRGAAKDAIPAISAPEYMDATAADAFLDAGDPVFGVSRDDEAKAYPQYILVWHEIVNGDLSGDGVSITYCPLTGTAQGFYRDDVTFGVSGMLLNSNLIMYDRETDSYWPQMLATGISGIHTNDTLVEFDVVWTTWENWRREYPDTEVLTEETGYARNYNRDPYGSYNPKDGHYEDGSLLYPPFEEAGSEWAYHPKTVFLGARTEDGSFAVEKAELAEAGICTGEVAGNEYVMVYDDALDTGWCYRNSDGRSITHDNGHPSVDGSEYPPDSLPLESIVRYDAMWFAWIGYYPDTVILT